MVVPSSAGTMGLYFSLASAALGDLVGFGRATASSLRPGVGDLIEILLAPLITRLDQRLQDRNYHPNRFFG
jgi:hypothetical protein